MTMHPIAHAATRPDHPAVIMAGSGQQISYGDMEAQSNRFAHLLRAHRINQGDAFAVLLENRIEYFTLIWGSQRAGTMLVPISSRLTAPEAAYIIRDAQVKLLITSGYFAGILGDIRKQCPGLTVLVMDSGDAEDFAAALAAQAPTPIPDQRAGMVILYS